MECCSTKQSTMGLVDFWGRILSWFVVGRSKGPLYYFLGLSSVANCAPVPPNFTKLPQPMTKGDGILYQYIPFERHGSCTIVYMVTYLLPFQRSSSWMFVNCCSGFSFCGGASAVLPKKTVKYRLQLFGPLLRWKGHTRMKKVVDGHCAGNLG